jgi:hypothetical protein
LLASRHAGGFESSSKLTSPVLALEYQEEQFGGEKECVENSYRPMLALKPSGVKPLEGFFGAKL